MSDLIEHYKAQGLISDGDWYSKLTCGDCKHFTGEECNGYQYQGMEVNKDSEACEDFENIEKDEL